MKYFAHICRLVIGSLFIVSGLIKCNDAIGFSYKLNDYFADGVLNLEFLIPYSLIIAASICIIEVVLGIAVIFGFKNKLSSLAILLMMLFFTWLTWYTSNCLNEQALAAELGNEFTKDCVTDCGCFGDALKLEPKESFYKDLVLLLFTIPLFIFSFLGKIKVNTIKQDIIYIAISLLLIAGFGGFVIGWWFSVLFSTILYTVIFIVKNKITTNQSLLLIIAFLICAAYTWYCYSNLPLRDFRPYKVNSNIIENMTVPDDALEALVEYNWKFNVNGNEEIFKTNGSYPTVDGEFIGVETVTIREAYEPPIHDFSMETNGEDYSPDILALKNLLIFVMYDIDLANEEGLKAVKEISDKAIENGYNVIALTAALPEKQKAYKDKYNFNFNFFFCDGTALKTIVRSNPGILKLEEGTIIQKLHHNNIDELELPKVTPEPFSVKKGESIMSLFSEEDKVKFTINGKETTLETINALDEDTIESMQVYKDSVAALKLQDISYNALVEIVLKDSID